VGFSYLIGLIAKDLEPNDWRFTMRFTPFLLVFVLILILLIYREPEREVSNSKLTEISDNDLSKDAEKLDINSKEIVKKSGFITDLKSLSENRTFVLYVFAMTCCLSSLGLLDFVQIIYQDKLNS
jgi:hypothetical protein